MGKTKAERRAARKEEAPKAVRLALARVEDAERHVAACRREALAAAHDLGAARLDLAEIETRHGLAPGEVSADPMVAPLVRRARAAVAELRKPLAALCRAEEELTLARAALDYARALGDRLSQQGGGDVPIRPIRRAVELVEIETAQTGKARPPRVRRLALPAVLAALPHGLQDVARAYQALVEAEAAPLGQGQEGGRAEISDGGAMRRYINGAKLAWLRAAIGPGIALAPARRSARAAISVRALVDAVCLDGASLASVLRAHGWADSDPSRATLRDSLESALGRMGGVLRL